MTTRPSHVPVDPNPNPKGDLTMNSPIVQNPSVPPTDPSTQNPIVAASRSPAATSLQAAVTTKMRPTVAEDPPAVTIPTPPATFQQPPPGTMGSHYPNHMELGAMRQTVLDLEAFAEFEALFGKVQTPAKSVSTAVTRALAWQEIQNATETWDRYVRFENALAWDAALKMLAEMKAGFFLAVAKDPSLAAKYPGLNAALNAGKQRAKKTVATKAKKAKAVAEAVAKEPVDGS